ncbi:MAG: formate dehydrogenase subunit gamma [Natronospirillum sp.]|nr:formate dehydrogenase subunit gamma [Natronospirillum sp.]MCH8533118.1 formate dehydrogenase subunit gamma [Saccharospirillum sp.]MCH8553320.1 formate dehydrogenase subunit gamma [Natronospirillum sp.]
MTSPSSDLHPNGPSPEAIADLIEPLAELPGAMLPVLHAIQDTCGYVPKTAIGVIAKRLQVTKAEVHGVISFYHHFRTQPPGQQVIQVCRAEACQAVGGRALEDHAQQALNLGYHQTSLTGEFTLEPVYCLGNCACGPSIRIGGRIHGRVTPERFNALIDALQTRPVEVQ